MKISKESISENETFTVNIDVQNIGNYDGEEVVQLYICDKVASITRPLKELKGFQKVAVSKGETKTVSFKISEEDLKFYNGQLDFAETFLDLAEAPIPEDMQGKSIVPLLKGETPDDWRNSLYYHYYEYPGAHSVRRHEGIASERYKLIRFYGLDVPNGEEWEFYDLESDPSEMNNIYENSEYAVLVENMKSELEALKIAYKVPAVPPIQ